MSRTTARHETIIEGNQVSVGTTNGAVRIGDLERIVDLVGGPAWEIEYTERQRRRYPDLDTSDEGLVVDVVDVVNGMELDDSIVATLQRLPPDPVDDDEISPRLGLFVGRLLGNLETGLD